jgi:hypothetical protein
MAFGDNLYALTTGHVVYDCRGQTFNIVNRVTGAVVKAQHLSVLHPENRNELAQEVGILGIHTADKAHVNSVIPRVDANKFHHGEKEYIKLEEQQPPQGPSQCDEPFRTYTAKHPAAARVCDIEGNTIEILNNVWRCPCC